jgi:hypothetical protein
MDRVYSTKGEKRNANSLAWESQKERARKEEQEVGGWMILN